MKEVPNKTFSSNQSDSVPSNINRFHEKYRLPDIDGSKKLEKRLFSSSGIRKGVGGVQQVKISKVELLIKFLKPITWIPVIWSFICGCVASGLFGWENLLDLKFWLGVLLTGPLVSGTCQMLNDYFDRDIDSINEPTRPIPAGDISLRNATLLIIVWSVMSVAVALYIHPFIAAHVVLGIINAHLYSANPIKLKKRIWAGNIIVAFSYLVYPWLAGEVAYSGTISTPSLIVSLLYAFSSTGTMTINDFKSTEGDTRVGIRTLPVVYGERKAAIMASVMIDIGQVIAAAYMVFLGEWINGVIIIAFIIPQIVLQRQLIESPATRDVWYNAIAQNFLVAGMLVCALAISNIQ
ncbi:bacteriochlorophyll/chlorophyll synthetase [Chloroherpeton thalassium ATCC 35110]|uniref:Bacteriochlorophyll/chlorophyll synthetase n=1 Tax=Chloroherpeton thalassium (strain ATCC 35110 / GB-78) TaxID=517418 RepID=B3QY89_CHLT3|nr:chlorophyll synthase ChlG [Chloroherpeton thalassium]ACF15055.1 bacteriochlorophyll/chlorophyll synthetase [Chloroherpeton thalassium ATCC 35110]